MHCPRKHIADHHPWQGIGIKYRKRTTKYTALEPMLFVLGKRSYIPAVSFQ